MAKSKADLESDYRNHEVLLDQALQARRAGDYSHAVAVAVNALDYLDGMLQYAKRYLEIPAQETVGSIDLVLKLSPLVLDFASLDRLGAILKAQRRIDKYLTADLAGELSIARSRLSTAHRLWNYVDSFGQVPQDGLHAKLGADVNDLQELVGAWIEMGVVRRTAGNDSCVIRLATNIDLATRAKCPTCGAVGKASKARLLDEIACPRCNTSAFFVILGDAEVS